MKILHNFLPIPALVILLLLAAIPARAESIKQCIGEPVRYVQAQGELPVVASGLDVDYPGAWSDNQAVVVNGQPTTRILYWTETTIRTGWLYEDAGDWFLFIFQPISAYDPATHVWHGACFLQVSP